VAWFAGCTCKNSSKWYTSLPKLLCNLYRINTIYKCGRGPQVGGPCVTVWDLVLLPYETTGRVLTILWVLSGAIAVISRCLWWEPRPARSESRDPPSSCLSLTLIILGTFATNDKRRESFRPSFVRRDVPANVLPTPVSMVSDDNHRNTINDFPLDGENFRNDSYILMHTSSQRRHITIPTKTNSFSGRVVLLFTQTTKSQTLCWRYNRTPSNSLTLTATKERPNYKCYFPF
jgi:hypothetical protein